MRKLVVLALLVSTACSSAPLPERDEHAKARALAGAFARYVHCHYAARLAAETDQAPPSRASVLRVREDLGRALHECGVELSEKVADEHQLKAVVQAARATLVAHDFVFLPLEQSGATEDDDLGIALAHVREREPARSQELWGKRVEYKLILYETVIRDYAGWRSRQLKVEGPIYSPGRFSGETVYIDHEELARRAESLPAPYEKLGIQGLLKEVELRQAAYLLFIREIPAATARDAAARKAAVEKLHERVLWTALRHGDPDVALADVKGLAANDRSPPELRAAAQRVLAKVPAATTDLPSKEKRAEVVRRLADEVWPTL